MPAATTSTPTHSPASPLGERRLRIALAHDWLCGFRGGEAVLDRIASLLAPSHDLVGLFTMFRDGRPLSRAIDALPPTTSFLNSLPGGSGPLRRWLLPLYPAAVASLSKALLREHQQRPIDLVISTSSAAVKGLEPPPGIPHLCYCHAPARYIWSLRDEYAAARGPKDRLRDLGLRLFSPALRRWDRRTAANVTRFLANSTHIRAEIARCYDRDAAVVFPPVRTDFFVPDPGVPREDFWLVVGALEPYKRVDLAIAAANSSRHPLLIVGDGSSRAALKRLAGPTVTFLGRVNDDELRRLYQRARLLLFPQIEDFGIVPVEAQACGLPVVARRKGGALDTVIDGKTGAFFQDPTPAALLAAAAAAPRDPEACRANALRFTAETFDRAVSSHIHELVSAGHR